MTDSNNSTRPIKKQEGLVTLAIRAVREPNPIAAPADTKRPPQTIRGGYLIVSRNGGNGRLKRIAFNPFEHGSLEEAKEQAAVLAARHGGEFSIFVEAASIVSPAGQEAPETVPQPHPAPEPAPPPQRRPVVVERRTSRARPQGGRA